jgi:hypothetical protein
VRDRRFGDHAQSGKQSGTPQHPIWQAKPGGHGCWSQGWSPAHGTFWVHVHPLPAGKFWTQEHGSPLVESLPQSLWSSQPSGPQSSPLQGCGTIVAADAAELDRIVGAVHVTAAVPAAPRPFRAVRRDSR